MHIPPNIFKAYDIRGIVPDEINPAAMEAIARAFAMFLCEQYNIEQPKIILSRDVRISSPELGDAAKRGLVAGGAMVTDVGITTTPMFYWITGCEGADGGFMVTASHNPPDYNGVKCVGRKVYPFAADNCFGRLRELIQNSVAAKKSGSAVEKDFLDAYVEFLADGYAFHRLTIAIDASNGATSIVLPKLMARFPELQIVPLFWEPDGRFPNHPPDPITESTNAALKEAVRKSAADFGVIFDGDGDRIFFVDASAKRVPASTIGALLAKEIIKEHTGATVLYSVPTSRILKETVEAAGGRALPCRTGHYFIKLLMRKENACFACEHSGHYYFEETFSTDNSMKVLLMVLDLMVKSGKSLSELAEPFERYVQRGEQNFSMRDWAGLEEALRAHYREGTIDTTDGITIDFPDWRFNVRPSNTEPLVRLNVEAVDQETLKAKAEELSNLIENA